jgi:uncharacterized SAM-binding protein YcdF (DUF218 family)
MKTENRTSPIRRIIGDTLLVTVVLLVVDIVIVMLRKTSSVVLKADYQELFLYELILCAILLLFALDVRFNLFTRSKRAAVRAAGWILRAVVVSLALVILFFCGKVIHGSLINTAGPADNTIVLGLALENGSPTSDLLARLDTARAYLEEHPEARLMLTGRNADESGRTEAAVMRDILAERGVANGRMVLEDQAKTTKENFRNTARIIDPSEPVVLISSNYHMDRAVQTAKAAGFSNVLRLPAPSSFPCYGANVMYEVVLELNELTLGK